MTTKEMMSAFENKFPEYLTPQEFLMCLEFAKRAMMNGETTVEGYYFAKELLFSKVKMPSEAIN